MIPSLEEWHPVAVALVAGVMGCLASVSVTVWIPALWRRWVGR